MIYLLDTDICIHLMRGTAAVVERAAENSPNDVAISAITAYELRFGALRCSAEHRDREFEKVETFVAAVHCLPFVNETARQAAKIRAHLESHGEPIGPMDTLIAACGLEHELTVVTGNLREFSRVPGLESVSWL